jgi:hypothetical protein
MTGGRQHGAESLFANPTSMLAHDPQDDTQAELPVVLTLKTANTFGRPSPRNIAL